MGTKARDRSGEGRPAAGPRMRTVEATLSLVRDGDAATLPLVPYTGVG